VLLGVTGKNQNNLRILYPGRDKNLAPTDCSSAALTLQPAARFVSVSGMFIELRTLETKHVVVLRIEA
jgi:hypothetical protein